MDSIHRGCYIIGKETVPIYSSNLTILILTLFYYGFISYYPGTLGKLEIDGKSWMGNVMFLYFVFLAQSLLLEYNVLSVGACPLVC